MGLEIKWSIRYIHGLVIAFLSAFIDLFSEGFKITKFPMASFLGWKKMVFGFLLSKELNSVKSIKVISF